MSNCFKTQRYSWRRDAVIANRHKYYKEKERGWGQVRRIRVHSPRAEHVHESR